MAVLSVALWIMRARRTTYNGMDETETRMLGDMVINYTTALCTPEKCANTKSLALRDNVVITSAEHASILHYYLPLNFSPSGFFDR